MGLRGLNCRFISLMSYFSGRFIFFSPKRYLFTNSANALVAIHLADL